MKILNSILTTLFFANTACATSESLETQMNYLEFQVFEVSDKANEHKIVDIDDIVAKHENKPTIYIFAESHDDTQAKVAKAYFTQEVVEKLGKVDNFDFVWEFLNIDEAGKLGEIERAFFKMSDDEKNYSELTKQLVGEHNINYLPVVESVYKLGGTMIPGNVTRSVKRFITKGKNGYEDVPVWAIPNDFQYYHGTQDYLELFASFFNIHHPDDISDNIKRYFEAQAFVDNILAHSALNYAKSDLRFILCGNVHAEFYLGVVEQIKKRQKVFSKYNIVTVNFVEKTENWKDKLNKRYKGKKISDYFILVEK